MDNQELISANQKAIVKIYLEQNIKNLREDEDCFTLNGKNIYEWYYATTNNLAAKSNSTFDYITNLDDILFCYDELIFFTANLYLYLPFINNPIQDSIEIGNRRVYLNHQNLAAKRFNMIADITSQCTYNYWDRIGALIASFFPGKIEDKNRYFSSAMNLIPVTFYSSENYKWLLSFKENDYKKSNSIRKQVVHYITNDSSFRIKHTSNIGDLETISHLHEERILLPDFYKKQSNLCLKGFEKTLLLLEEMSEKFV